MCNCYSAWTFRHLSPCAQRYCNIQCIWAVCLHTSLGNRLINSRGRRPYRQTWHLSQELAIRVLTLRHSQRKGQTAYSQSRIRRKETEHMDKNSNSINLERAREQERKLPVGQDPPPSTQKHCLLGNLNGHRHMATGNGPKNEQQKHPDRFRTFSPSFDCFRPFVHVFALFGLCVSDLFWSSVFAHLLLPFTCCHLAAAI